MPGYDTISFLSDYGTRDEFVGIVKSVIRGIAPSAAVIDLTHEIPPYDVRAGSLTLARAAEYLCPGVVLAVVDPGVGTERRGVAVEVGGGSAVLVGPDNGLLAPAVAMVGGADRAVVLDNPDYCLPTPGATFDGRDIFGPAAAHLCAGVPLTELGTPIDPATLLPGVLPLPREESDGLHCEVLWVDHYGNAQLNVGPEDVAGLGDRVALACGDAAATRRTAIRAETFAEIGAGQVGLVLDSYGLVALCLDRRSAAAELGIDAGDAVVLSVAGDDRDHTTSVAVTLGHDPRSVR